MAYGQFESYEPIPDLPGAYRFNTASGNPYTFGGPEAERLRSRLDAANAATMTAGGEAAGALPEPPPAPTPAAETIKVNAPEKTAAIAEKAMDEGPSLVPYIRNEIDTGLLYDPNSKKLYRRGGGTAGVSKEQLEAQSENLVPQATAQSVSTTGGFERDADYMEAMSDARINEQLAVEKQRDAELNAVAEGRKVAQEQFAATAGQIDEQQRLANEIAGQVRQARTVREQALKDYNGSQVDPNRIFHGGARPLLGIMAAIAAGGGAYAAAINKTENFAMKAIDTAIRRDIAAQEADIRIKKDASDTALADLMRRGMDLKQAKGTLETIQKDWAAQKSMLAKGASSSDVINAKHDMLIAKMQTDAIKEAENYDIDSQGKATKATQFRMLAPRAATAGGLIELTPEEASKESDKKTAFESSAAGTGKTLGEVKKDEAAAKAAGGKKPLANEQKKAIADLDAALAGIDEFEKMDTAGGKVLLGTTGTFANKHRKQIGAIANALGPGLARAVEGDAATKESMDRATGGLTALTYDQRQVTREEYRKQLIRKRQAILDGQQ